MLAYIPFIWAALWRRPIRTILAFVSVTIAFTISGASLGMYEVIPPGGGAEVLAQMTLVIAAGGMLLILFLTGTATAHAVRQRIPEFAILKAIGFSDVAIIGLVFTETLLPFLFGAVSGLFLCSLLNIILKLLVPPEVPFPVPVLSFALIAAAFPTTLLVTFLGTVLPASRIARIDVAKALMKE